MRPPLCPPLYILSSNLSLQLLSSLTPNPQSPFHSLNPFSSTTSTQNPKKWNSNTQNLMITNPTLLLIESCNSMSQLKEIQAHMTRTGLLSHIFPISRVISFCALSDFGNIGHARMLFDKIPEPNVYIWNTMIRGYCKAHNPVMGMYFFREMVRGCVEMDSRSFVFALKVYEVVGWVEVGVSVHCRIWKVGFVLDLIVRNGLIHFYGDCGCLGYAQKVFDESCERDVVSWSALIDGYLKMNMADEALRVFDLMLESSVEPNEVTMITVFSACAQKGDLRLGMSIQEYVEKYNVKRSLNLMNAMLDMHIKCGCLTTANEIFDEMEVKDVFSWTSMINGYAKKGDLDMARRCFDEMPERNVVSWNAMIAGYSQNNKPEEALELFHDMGKEGLVPIESTLVCVLSACAQSGRLDLGQWIHNYYVKQNRTQSSVILKNAFIDMYAKCGSIVPAAEIFNEMRERDLVSWNSMIVGYASHGHAGNSLVLFEKMKSMGLKPDDITFVGVLSACSHGGLVKQGWEYFINMEIDYGLKPKVEHYACMIDLLGRIGHLEEAYELITKMPMEPDEAAWGALLNACRTYGNVELGKLAADKLILLDPKDSGIYVLLASLCANKKKWGDVRAVRTMMREKGIKKTPGQSLIEVDGEFHEFLVADESHQLSKDIYRVLNQLFLLSKLDDHLSDNISN